MCCNRLDLNRDKAEPKQHSPTLRITSGGDSHMSGTDVGDVARMQSALYPASYSVEHRVQHQVRSKGLILALPGAAPRATPRLLDTGLTNIALIVPMPVMRKTLACYQQRREKPSHVFRYLKSAGPVTR